MRLTPVEATLIAASVGASASIVASTATALLTQRRTRERERDLKLWERHIDAIETTLRYKRDWASKRRTAMRDKVLPASLDIGLEPNEVGMLEAKLLLFGSDALVTSNQKSFEAFRDWTASFFQWRAATAQLESAADPDEARRVADALWQQVELQAAKSEAADDSLTKALRVAASLHPRRTRGFMAWRETS